MDYDKLIERLKSAAGGPDGIKMCQDAALAIETLRAELARVTAERDGAVEEVKHLKAVMRDEGIVVIPPKHPWEKSEWNV